LAIPLPAALGPDSDNDGAGTACIFTAARIVHGNMPLGSTFEAPEFRPTMPSM